jgi:hypothetical protein
MGAIRPWSILTILVLNVNQPRQTRVVVTREGFPLQGVSVVHNLEGLMRAVLSRLEDVDKDSASLLDRTAEL